MESWREEILKDFERCEPLSEAEIAELSRAVYRLAEDGTAVPRQLMRHAKVEEGRRYYGSTLDALPQALDLLGPDREAVVVGLLRRFEQAVRDHHNQVNNREKGTPLDEKIMARYFDVVFFLKAAKPKTEKSIAEVADFLRSEKDEVHEHASEMLQGAPYFPVIIDRLFENISTHGIRQWPNRQARALASFAYVPEVRLRLMNCFRSEDENLRDLAIMAFACLKEDAGPEAEAELFAIAENDADKRQSQALNGLREIAGRNIKLRQLALRLIQSDKYWVRGHAIACLEAFPDRECIEALLSALLDEGGHDFDNAGDSAKLLMKMKLDPSEVLGRLMTTLEALLAREDKLHESQSGYRASLQALADGFKVAAEMRGDNTEGLGVVTYSSPETLLAVARIVGHLGAAAHTAKPLIEKCIARPYVSGAGDEEEWKAILKAIEKE